MRKFVVVGCMTFLSSAAYAGLFTAHWSIKLQPVATEVTANLHVVDQRPAEQKKFRMVDFLKVSYKSYLGDVNTTPDRMAILAAKVSKIAATRPDAMSVEITQFEILHDQSGSACKGCALAAVSYPAAIGAEAGREPGDDAYACRITGSIDGNVQSAEVVAPYHPGAFDNNNSAPSVTALQTCVDGAIEKWMLKAMQRTESGTSGSEKGN